MWEKSPMSEIKETLYCVQVSKLQNEIDIAVYNMRIVKLLDWDPEYLSSKADENT
jgi:hypothetical protein